MLFQVLAHEWICACVIMLFQVLSHEWICGGVVWDGEGSLFPSPPEPLSDDPSDDDDKEHGVSEAFSGF